LKTLFLSDIAVEVERRQQLLNAGNGKPIPTLLDITPIAYISGKGTGVKKTRYITERCSGSISNLVFDKTTFLPLPLEKQKLKEALTGCRDALVALREMHKRGMVHKDVKPDNILYSFKEKKGQWPALRI